MSLRRNITFLLGETLQVERDEMVLIRLPPPVSYQVLVCDGQFNVAILCIVSSARAAISVDISNIFR
jgi:predicted choloylglycine hydrolase